MRDSILIRVSLTGALVGIVVLWILSVLVEVPVQKFSEISPDDTFITIYGTVSSVDQKENIVFLTLVAEEYKDAIVFTSEPFSVKEGERIKAIVTVDTYNGKDQLIVQELEVI